MIGVVGVLVMLWFNLNLYPHNSDHYFFPRVAQDLIEQGSSLADWVLISAPRYFPDLLIDVVSFSIVGSGLAGRALGAILLVLVQWFAVSLLAWRAGAALPTSALAGMLYCAMCAIVGAHYTSFSYIAWHTGTFSIIILCLALMLAPDQRPGPAAVVGAMVLAALVSASNVLTLPILIPGLGLLSLVYLMQNYRRKSYLLRFHGWWRLIMVPGVAGVVGCAAGVALYRYAMPYPFINPVNASSLNMGAIKNPWLAFQAGLSTLESLFTLPVFVAALMVAAVLLVVCRHTRLFPALVAIVLFWLLTSCLNQGLIELGANNELRYRIIPINGSIAIISIGLVLIADRWRLRFVLPGVAAIAMAVTWTDVQSLGQQRHQDWMTETACLKQHVIAIFGEDEISAGGIVGVSDQSRTNILPYTSQGVLRLIATKGSSRSVLPYMQDASLMSRRPVYAIALKSPDPADAPDQSLRRVLTEWRVRAQYGEPAALHSCRNHVVMSYPSGLSLTPPRHLNIPAPPG